MTLEENLMNIDRIVFAIHRNKSPKRLDELKHELTN